MSGMFRFFIRVLIEGLEAIVATLSIEMHSVHRDSKP